VATLFMLSVSEARERILNAFQPLEKELAMLERCAGRVLAEDILAGNDLPPFDNSAMDGFALHPADLNSRLPLAVVADIRAGSPADIRLQPGECARIMTGAPVPAGAEAVVAVEDTDFNERAPGNAAPAMVTIHKSLVAGENIRCCGEDLKKGAKILNAERRLRAQDIGLLAMLGMAEVPVHRKPRVALLSSGDELIPVEEKLTPGKIHDSNSYTLAAMAEQAGVELIRLGVAQDTEVAVRSRLEQAVEEKADVIVSSAGVSVGAFDYVKAAIEQDGELDFWKVHMRPGRPLAFGKFHGIPFFGLPGNPVSAFIGFEVFVKPSLEKLSGLNNQPHPKQIAILAEALESDGRESYLRAIVNQENGVMVAHLTGGQGSGNIFSLVRANALLIVPSGVKSLPASSEVEIWPIA
jgi:molybdopterin molybdotransferase